MTVPKVSQTQPNPALRLSGFGAMASAQPFDQLLAQVNSPRSTPASASDRAANVQRADTVRNDRRSEVASSRSRGDDHTHTIERHNRDSRERPDAENRASNHSTDRTGTTDLNRKNTEKQGDFGGQASSSYDPLSANNTDVQTNSDVSTDQSLETQASGVPQGAATDPLGIITTRVDGTIAGQTGGGITATASLTQGLNLKTPVTIDSLNPNLPTQTGVVSATAVGDEVANTAGVLVDQSGLGEAQINANGTIVSVGTEGSSTGLEAISASGENAQGLPGIAQAGAKLTASEVTSGAAQGPQNAKIQNFNQESLNAPNQVSGQATTDTAQTSDQNSGDTTSRDHQAHSEAESLKVVAKTAAALGNETSASFSVAKSPNLTYFATNTAASATSVPTQGASATDASTTQAPLLSGSDTAQSNANVSRVIRGMHGAINQNGGAVTLRLSPPEMGIVRIEMQIHSGTVTAQLHTEHESARTLLNQQLGQLRHALESQGLNVDRLQVQTMGQETLSHTADQGADRSADEGRSRGQHTGAGQRQRDDDSHHDAEFGGDQSDQPASRFEQELNMVA